MTRAGRCFIRILAGAAAASAASLAGAGGGMAAAGAADVGSAHAGAADVGAVREGTIPPAGAGASDFTVEFRIRGLPAEREGGAGPGGGDAWMDGCIAIDREGGEGGERGGFGVCVGEGRVTFECAGTEGGATIRGTSTILDGAWHLVAVDRRLSDGRMRIFVDGALEASGDGRGDGGGGGERTRLSFYGRLEDVRYSSVLRHDESFPSTGARSASAAEAGADGPGASGKIAFEAHAYPSLDQTLFFVRCEAPRDDAFVIAIVDAAGREVARIAGKLARGSALAVWDGRGGDGDRLRAGVYSAKLAAAGREASEQIVVR